MTGWLVLLIALGALTATMTGGVLALKLETKLPLLVGFSAGAVIGVAFFDLAPEALEAGKGLYEPRSLLALAALGFFLYTVLDRVVARHDCEGQANPARGMVGELESALWSDHEDAFAHSVEDRFHPRAIGLVLRDAIADLADRVIQHACDHANFIRAVVGL